MKYIEMMNYNFENIDNKLPVHTELGKKIIELNKVNDMNKAWLSCSDEVGARAIADSFTTYKQDYEESKRMAI